jgi:drug/metabolite transporter (DMT)-like permease
MKQIIALIIATICWGLWGFASKMAADRIPPFTVLMGFSLPWVLFLPLGYFLSTRQEAFLGISPGFYWGIGSGLAALVGMFTFTLALRWGASSFGVLMVSVYPLITLILLVLTGQEHFTIYHLFGSALIVGGLMVLQIGQ